MDVPGTAQPGSTAYRPIQGSLRKRASIRKAVSCSVQVRHGDSFIIPRVAEDLSLTGIFVEMDTQDISIGDSVEVWVGVTNKLQQPLELVLSADVVRIHDNGLALKFRAYPNKAYTELVNLLYAG